ncbi:MAG TPA: hypothetical protein VL793_12765 [Patescibacteria group bacterium]|nr:hypothetical protein [Patescibacteria group bacterium]
MKTATRLFLLVLLLVLAANPSSAQNFSIDWFSINSGGGASAGGNFELRASIGEAGNGKLSGGVFSIDAGYWAIESTQPLVIPPQLSIAATLTNTVVVSWPSSSTGFSLQQSTVLSSTSWTDVSVSPIDDGTIKLVVLPLSSNNLFLRLKQ